MMKPREIRKIFIPITLLLILAATTVWSEGSKSYSYTFSSNSKSDLSLTIKEESFADDLQYILDQLEKNSRDYINYFSGSKNEIALELQNDLIQTLINIKTKKYTVDLPLLKKDLSKLIEKSESSENKIKSSKEDRVLYRNISTLRQNLEMMLEIINEDLIPVALDDEQTQKIKLYLVKDQNENPESVHYEHKLYQFSEQLKENLEKQVELQKLTELDKKDIKEAVKLATELSKVYSLQLEELVSEISLESLPVFEKDGRFTYVIPRATEVPEPPDAPDAPDIVVFREELPPTPSTNRFISGSQGSRLFNDSLFVLSEETPISVNNPTGNVKISGWDNDFVKANLSISVITESDQATKALLNDIKLSFQSNNKQILVQPEIPSLTNPSRKIISCQLNVYVPYQNPINCQSSYGEVDIREIDNLSTKLSNSRVRLTDVFKKTSADLNNCELLATDCQGIIELDGNRGPFVLEDCSAEFKLNNNYGTIEISDCLGNVGIKNNNSISIFDHTGNINIKNENGLIKLSNIQGNLEIENSFKPIIISDINGNLTLTNKHSSINLESIYGNVKATSEASSIIGRDLNGTIDISNESGKTTLYLNDQFAGTSKIKSDYGIISLFLSKDSDILLTTPSSGANLKGSFDRLFIPKDKSTNQFIIGNGNKVLAIDGINTTVVVGEN